MEKIVNRLLIITAAAAAVFGALAFVFRNAEHDNAAEGDENFSVCDYVELNLLKLNAEIIPYSGDEIRVCQRIAAALRDVVQISDRRRNKEKHSRHNGPPMDWKIARGIARTACRRHCRAGDPAQNAVRSDRLCVPPRESG